MLTLSQPQNEGDIAEQQQVQRQTFDPADANQQMTIQEPD